jgi:hypothetical protein
MKTILPVIAVAAATAVFASPALTCERHQNHTAMNTVEAVSAPAAAEVVIEPAAQSNPTLEIKTENAMNVPMAAAYGNCNKSRQNQTVDLTQ